MGTDGLPAGYWIGADAAYMCSESILVPFSSVKLQDTAEGVWRDTFNFFKSSHRVHVEQTFGMLILNSLVYCGVHSILISLTPTVLYAFASSFKILFSTTNHVPNSMPSK